MVSMGFAGGAGAFWKRGYWDGAGARACDKGTRWSCPGCWESNLMNEWLFNCIDHRKFDGRNHCNYFRLLVPYDNCTLPSKPPR